MGTLDREKRLKAIDRLYFEVVLLGIAAFLSVLSSWWLFAGVFAARWVWNIYRGDK